MERITFECQVITPMFLAGADGQTPDLRPPSIKGAMRFWWRAVNGHLPLADLKRLEADIFGSQDKRSKVEVEVEIQKETPVKISYLPHYPEICEYENKWEKCNYYRQKNNSKKCSFLKRVSNNGAAYKNICVKGIKRLSKLYNFNLNIYFYPTQIRYKEQIFFQINRNYIKSAFYITSFLGGLGKRSRRGFGSFMIKKISYDNNSQESNIEYTTERLFEELNNICLDNKKFELEDNKIVSRGFSGNWPWIEEIIFGVTEENFEGLLKKIGDATHKFNDNSLGLAYKGWRFASPIYVSTIKNDKYQIVVTKLNIPKLDNSNITILNSKKRSKTFMLDFNKQEDFIKTLTQ